MCTLQSRMTESCSSLDWLYVWPGVGTGTQVVSVALSYIQVILAIMFAKQAVRAGWDSSSFPWELEQLSFHTIMGQAQGAHAWLSVTPFHSVCNPTSGKPERRLLLYWCLHCTLLPFQFRTITLHCLHTHHSWDCGGLRGGDGTVSSQSPLVQSCFHTGFIPAHTSRLMYTFKAQGLFESCLGSSCLQHLPRATRQPICHDPFLWKKSCLFIYSRREGSGKQKDSKKGIRNCWHSTNLWNLIKIS